MKLDSRQPILGTKVMPSGVVFDHGTGKRIPFVTWFDAETGEYEQHIPAANGVDVLVHPITRIPYRRKGKATGRLELIPITQAHLFNAAPPQKVVQRIQTITYDQKLEGMKQYKSLFYKVEEIRGNSQRVTNGKWDDFLLNNSFLDDFVLRRHTHTTT